jgi:HSP20 family protein
MTIRDLMHWGDRKVPVRRAYPFGSLTRDMNRLFDAPMGFPFTVGHGWPDVWGTTDEVFNPRMDLTETDTTMRVSAELPGMTVDDIDVTLSAGTLTIKGEKTRETSSEEEGDYHTERYFGSFRRAIALPAEVDTEGVAATFDKGVLTVTMAKAEAKEETHKIEVKAA